jgi:hypothetical protein
MPFFDLPDSEWCVGSSGKILVFDKSLNCYEIQITPGDLQALSDGVFHTTAISLNMSFPVIISTMPTSNCSKRYRINIYEGHDVEPCCWVKIDKEELSHLPLSPV